MIVPTAVEDELDFYEVTLESEGGASKGQQRVVSLQAPSEDVANEIALDKERKIVDFSLEIPSREKWELPRHKPEGEDSPNAHVDLARWDAYDKTWANWAAGLSYDEARAAARTRLTDFRDRIEIDKRGKVRGKRLNGKQAARFLAYLQSEPYAIVDTKKVDRDEIRRRQLASELAQLTTDPKAWDKKIAEMRAKGDHTAVVTAALYGLPWQKQIDGSGVTILSSAAIQNTLHTGYSANIDTEDFFNDVSASEITGTGYSANGVAAASKTSTYDTATDQIRLDWADVSWTTSTLSATDLVIWVNTAGISSTDMLWGNVDFGATVTTTAGTFLVTFDATGVVVFDIT